MKRSNVRMGTIWLMLAAALGLSPGVESRGREAVQLFEPLPEEKLKQVPQQERMALRRRFVTANPAMLIDSRKPAGRPLGTKRISLALFDGEQIEARLGRLDSRDDDSYSWLGWTPGEDVSDVVLTVVDGVMMGTIYRDDQTFLLRAITRTVYELMEVDVSRLPPEDGEALAREDINDLLAAEVIRPQPLDRRQRLQRERFRRRNLRRRHPRYEAHELEDGIRRVTDSGARIDLMVAYTPEAAAQAATLRDVNGNIVDNVTDIHTLIQHGVDRTNLVVGLGGIPTTFHVVRTLEVAAPEPEASTSQIMLAQLDEGGFYHDELLQAADESRADIISLFVEGRDEWNACGRARTMTSIIDPSQQIYTDGRGENYLFGKNIVRAECGLFGFTLTHELGHNVGLKHDHFVLEPGSQGATPIGFGFVLVPPRKITMMAYPDLCRVYFPGESCKRLPRFSDPLESYAGYPLGLQGGTFIQPANSVEAMKQALWTVANFRHSLLPPP